MPGQAKIEFGHQRSTQQDGNIQANNGDECRIALRKACL